MNKKIITFLLLGAIVLTGCSNDKKYDDLERRVSNLEQKVGIVETSTIQTTQNNVETSEIIETSSQYQENYSYSLEGMTAEEISNECIKLLKLPMSCVGKTREEYYEVIGHKNFQDNSYPNIRFVSDIVYGYEPEINCITNLNVSGVRAEMDDRIGWRDPDNPDDLTWYYGEIRLYIKDYDTAAKVYDLVLSSFNYNIKEDNREGTYWSTYIESPQGYNQCATMSKQNNGYELYLRYYEV